MSPALLVLLWASQGGTPNLLPKPTGPFPVGHANFEFVDTSRKDLLDPAKPRAIPVEVWYPATKAGGASPYIDAKLLAAMKANQYMDIPAGQLDAWAQQKIFAQQDAPVRPSKYPLLVFSPGLGLSAKSYSTISEQIASCGFIVATIDHPYCGLTVLVDGRTLYFDQDKKPNPVERVTQMALDQSFVITRLTDKVTPFSKHVDTSKIGVFGHSLGGAAALESGLNDRRVVASADLDGDVWGAVESKGTSKPYLVLLNQPGLPVVIPERMRKERDDEWDGVMAKQPTPGVVACIHDVYHLNFSDFPFVLPRESFHKNGSNLDPNRSWLVITDLVRDFFQNRFSSKGLDGFVTRAKGLPEVSILRSRL